MAEILTESFCERCGTRYTFESPARRANPLGALGTVGRGLKNFVVSPDQSIDEAFAVARADAEQKATAHQLEAFHQTFNFCLSCRQYTCANCWNAVEGRCQSCAPLPEPEVLPQPEIVAVVDVEPETGVVAEALAIARAAAMPAVEPESAVESPDADVAEPEPPAEIEAVAALAEIEGAREPSIEVEPEPSTEVEAEPWGDFDVATVAEAESPATMKEVEAAPSPAVAAEPEPDAAASPSQPASPLTGLPPGVSLDEEIAAYELRVAALSAPVEPATPPVPEPIEPTPAPAAPIVERPGPTPMRRPTPVPEPLRPAASMPSPRAGDLRPIDVPPPQPVRIVVSGAVEDLPAASAVTMPAAQSTGSCPSCGLTLSATARFCRRCGTAQHVA